MDFEINGSTVTLIDPGSSANSSHQNSDPNEAHIPTQIPLGEKLLKCIVFLLFVSVSISLVLFKTCTLKK